MINTELFWAKVNGLATDGCWTWQGPLRPKGYGTFHVKKVPRYAHRIAYLLAHGSLPEYVCHACDNPSCVNPDHLFAGNALVNNRDMIAKGRDCNTRGTHNRPQGEDHPHAKLKAEMVLKIREDYARGVKPTPLAREYGVSAGTIHRIVGRKSWRNI